MHARRPARRPLIVLVLALAGAFVAGTGVPAGAHTEVLRASPSPGEAVSGPVQSVELTFLDPVEPDVRIEVRDPSGDVVADLGAVQRSEDGRRASVTFAELGEAGDYVVEYHFTALDGDSSRETYRFTLLPEAGGDGLGAGALAGALGVAIVLLVGLVVALHRRRGPD